MLALRCGAGEQAVVPYAVKAVGQHVDQEPADELVRGEPHDLLPVAGLDAVVLPAEGNRLGVGADQAAVRDRDAVGVAAEIGQHRLGAAEGRLGIDHPFGLAERGKPGGEGVGVRESGQVAEEDQRASAMQRAQPLNEQAAKQPGQHPHMQEEARAAGNPAGAVQRQAAAGDDHVDMGMVGQRRAPGQVSGTDVPGLIQAVFDTLTEFSRDEEPAPALTPAVPIRRSVTDDYIVCLEDGKKLKMLKRHLMTAYGMTPEQYRAKWGLPQDYPMVAPSYAWTRQELAKKIGLGRKPKSEPAAKPRRSTRKAKAA